MNKEFITHDEAIALKELGFDEPCIAYYQKSSVIGDDTILPLIIRKDASNWNNNSFSKLGVPYYSAPLYQQAFRWFREEHSLSHMVSNNLEAFVFAVEGAKMFGKLYNSYEEAELACLKKLIELKKELLM